jgi:putative PIN family toxin of toxin-antitoxin system
VSAQPVRRVVFDTNVVLSALLFPAGRLAWLRAHWREGSAVPLISPATARELTRVLGYSKFRLSEQYRIEALALYLPYCESLDPVDKCLIECRDAKDQPFLDLAHCGKADVLVTGDRDILALAGQAAFLIETPEEYRRRVSGAESIL